MREQIRRPHHIHKLRVEAPPARVKTLRVKIDTRSPRDGRNGDCGHGKYEHPFHIVSLKFLTLFMPGIIPNYATQNKVKNPP